MAEQLTIIRSYSKVPLQKNSAVMHHHGNTSYVSLKQVQATCILEYFTEKM